MTGHAKCRAHIRVAIVDDDARVLESLTDLLESAGYDVRPFPSATEFIAHGALISADCLITDVSMPGLTGLELAGLAERNWPGLPVVLITGHEETWRQAQTVARDRPLRFLFRKPLDGNALLTAVEQAVKK
jgi:FixJ family two-component response regulator